MIQRLELPTIKTFHSPFKAYGIEFGNTMTVVKLNNGLLWVHSPISLDAQSKENLENFGRVKFVVAPNDFHYLHIKEFMAIYMDAEYIGSPGLKQKCPQLKFSRYFNNEYQPEWKSEIDFLVLNGAREFSEVIFYHIQTQTLIVTDLIMKLEKSYNPLASILLSIVGTKNKYATSRIIRQLVKNKLIARDILKKVTEWPFQRIILSHGPIIDKNAHLTFKNAIKWAL